MSRHLITGLAMLAIGLWMGIFVTTQQINDLKSQAFDTSYVANEREEYLGNAKMAFQLLPKDEKLSLFAQHLLDTCVGDCQRLVVKDLANGAVAVINTNGHSLVNVKGAKFWLPYHSELHEEYSSNISDTVSIIGEVYLFLPPSLYRNAVIQCLTLSEIRERYQVARTGGSPDGITYHEGKPFGVLLRLSLEQIREVEKMGWTTVPQESDPSITGVSFPPCREGMER